MSWFKAEAHDAEVSSDRSKTHKDRLVGRAGRVTTALKGKGLPKSKRVSLKAEMRSILLELDAREEAVNKIMSTFED